MVQPTGLLRERLWVRPTGLLLGTQLASRLGWQMVQLMVLLKATRLVLRKAPRSAKQSVMPTD
jgi:hypothetical protein